MKIGIIADLHLKGKETTPERYEALEYVLQELKNRNVKTLIISGDLFDKNYNNYSDFEEIAERFHDIDFYIIPGNHDAGLKNRYFSSKNIHIF